MGVPVNEIEKAAAKAFVAVVAGAVILGVVIGLAVAWVL